MIFWEHLFQNNQTACFVGFLQFYCPTHWNMTEDEYINNVTGTVRNKEEAFNILVNHLKPFSEVIDRFVPNNMTENEFREVVREMGSIYE